MRSVALVLIILGAGVPAAIAHASDPRESAQQLSDQAFAILNSLNADSSKSKMDDLLGGMASFAGDAQSLSTSLARGDSAGAKQALDALISDRRVVDAALEKNPSALDKSKWNGLKAQLADLEKNPVVSSASPPAPAAASSVPGVGGAPEATTAPPLASDSGRPPVVKIISRVSGEDGIQIKGYLEGRDLRSAGIYQGGQLLKVLELSPTRGDQRVDFDIKVEQASSGEVIRTQDGAGRIAEAPIATNDSTVNRVSAGHERTIELDPTAPSSEPAAPAEAPPVVASRESNTAEIPSNEDAVPPRHRPGEALGPLTDVQINVLGVMDSSTQPGSYEIVGQISGSGIHRAGVYVDGRQVRQIPITAGPYSSFDVSFPMLGRVATIRVYGAGSNFAESAIDLASAGTIYGLPATGGPYARVNPYPYGAYPYGTAPNPYPPNPYGYGYPPPPGYPAYPPPNTPWWRRFFP